MSDVCFLVVKYVESEGRLTAYDKSRFEHNGTTVPEWACRMWALSELYGQVTSRKDPKSNATVQYKGHEYKAWVTTAPHGRKSPAFRLWFDRILSLELKRTFLMSYMRSLEDALQDVDSDVERKQPARHGINLCVIT
jgi:hypothetical protein